MDRPSCAFTLAGIEPKDNTFKEAGEDVHRSFWRFIVQVGIEVKTRSLLQGLGADGATLRRLTPYTIKHRRSAMGPAEPDAPPLIPAGELSRTIALLTGRAFGDHAEWFWRTDPITGLPWGRVLHWHRIGAGGLPVRDVIGLSFEDWMEILRRGQQWWSAHQRGRAVVVAAEQLGVSIGPGHPAFPSTKPAIPGRTEVERTGWALAEGYRAGFSDSLREVAREEAPPSALPPDVISKIGKPTCMACHGGLNAGLTTYEELSESQKSAIQMWSADKPAAVNAVARMVQAGTGGLMVVGGVLFLNPWVSRRS
jgi:hypothetical protein